MSDSGIANPTEEHHIGYLRRSGNDPGAIVQQTEYSSLPYPGIRCSAHVISGILSSAI